MYLDYKFVILAFALVVVLYYCKYAIRLIRFGILYYKINKLPGPETSLFRSHLSTFDEKEFLLLEEWAAKYPKLHKLKFGPYLQVFVSDPEIAQKVFDMPKDHQFDEWLRPILGNGLVMSSGDIWRRNRKLLTPLFHSKCLRGYCQALNYSSDRLINVLSKFVDKEPFDFCPYPQSLTLEAIINSICSKECDLQSNPNPDSPEMIYFNHTTEAFVMFLDRFTNLFYLFDATYYRSNTGKKFLQYCRKSTDFIQSLIDERRHQWANEPSSEVREYNDMLDLLLKCRDEQGQGLSDKEIVDELSTFIFAGQATTATAVIFVVYQLAQNPDWQHKCREEVERVLGPGKDTIEYDDVTHFTYLTQCIKETLRLYPPAFAAAKISDIELQIDGYTIPKGTTVNLSMQSIHYNPLVWKDPKTFDPDRFSAKNMDNTHPYAYLPFSAGQRNCIGQLFAMTELKVLLAKLIRAYEITLQPGYKLERCIRSSILPKDNLMISLKHAGK